MARSKRHAPKLPVQQLSILAVARFAEPLALTSVFPYLPEMIQSFGVDKNEVARWAGITGAVFSVTQSMAAVPWGKASDRFGRKPVILVGLFSTMICIVIWGLSTSLTMAITVRAVMGGGNGNVGIIRTMVAEMVPERELQPRAFSIMPLVWSVGSVFGPAFGGFFARPAEQYPGLFGENEFFKKYPFALPNILACVVFFFSLMAGLLFLEETLESKRHTRDWGLALGEKLTRPFRRSKHHRKRRPSFVDDEARTPLLPQAEMISSKPVISKPPSASEIFTSQTIINLISYTFLALHSVTFDQILPVFLNYPRQIPDEHNTQLPLRFSGGFGISSDRIGTIFTIYGIGCGIVQFFVFPPLCTRFGVLNCLKVAALCFPVVYMLVPYTALIQDDTLRYVVFAALMFFKGCVVIVGFPCTTILLTNSASSLRVLGTLNGYATTFSGIGRAAGPAITGAIFTAGVQKGYMILPWWFLAAVSLGGAITVWFIVEGPGPTPTPVADDDEDEDDTLDGGVGDDDDDYGETRFITGADGECAPRISEDLILMEPEDPDTDSDSSASAFKLPSQVKLRPVSADSQDRELSGSSADLQKPQSQGDRMTQ